MVCQVNAHKYFIKSLSVLCLNPIEFGQEKQKAGRVLQHLAKYRLNSLYFIDSSSTHKITWNFKFLKNMWQFSQNSYLTNNLKRDYGNRDKNYLNCY